MRSRPIGSKSTLTPNADRMRQRSARRRAGNGTVTGPADIFPTDVRIDGGRRKQKLVSKGRMIITDDALYIAESPDRGLTVSKVTKHPLPEGERRVTASTNGSWGNFSWSPCGCANSWGRHTKASLIALGDAKDG